MIQVSETHSFGNVDLTTLDIDVSPGVLEVSLLYSGITLEEVIFSIVSHLGFALSPI